MKRITQKVKLPSGIEAELIEGDGYTERALLKKNKRIYETIPYYLAAMVIKLGDKSPVTHEDIGKLLTPDQEALLIETYKLNYGDVFDFEHTCISCEKPFDVGFDLAALEFRPLPTGTEWPDPVLEITLPRSKKKASIGCLDGKKEALLMGLQAAGNLDLNQADFQCLRSLDGARDFSYEDVVKLPLADHRAIRKARKKLVCGYDTDISIQCPFCDTKDSVNLFLVRDFLFSG